MDQKPPTFDAYISQIARPGKNEARAACLNWLREQSLMGLLPKMTLQSGIDRWNEFYKLMPAVHRAEAGKLWRSYVNWRAMHKWKAFRPRGKQRRMRQQRWAD